MWILQLRRWRYQRLCRGRIQGFSFSIAESPLQLSRSSPDSGPLPLSNVFSSIVAVHGLGGHPYDTWTEEKSGKMWLRDFLPSQVPHTRIMSYGYDSLVAFSKSEIELGDVAADLLNRLDGERGMSEVIRPKKVSCHSPRANTVH